MINNIFRNLILVGIRYGYKEFLVLLFKLKSFKGEQFLKNHDALKVVNVLLGKSKFNYDLCLLINREEETLNIKYKHIYEKILVEFENINFEKYSPDRWKTLERFFIAQGLFRLAEICHENSVTAQIHRKDYGLNIIKKSQCFLEIGDFLEAEKKFEKYKNRWYLKFVEYELIELNNYIEILNNGKARYLRDENYYKYISGRACAIVGPAYETEANGDRKLEKRVIIRNNEVEPSDLNKKTSISYYNWEAINNAKNNPRHLNYVSKEIEYISIKQMNQLEGVDKPIHNVGNCILLSWNGEFNMLPLMILDLKVHGVKDLIVCGNNMYLGKIYSSNYTYGYKKANDKQCKIFAIHNPFTQKIILDNLRKVNCFTPSSELKSVLDMNLQEYAFELEKRFA